MTTVHIGEIVDRHVAAGQITGGIVLVKHRGEVLYLDARGAADTDPSFTLHHDTVYWVASMTKPIIATAAMMLVDEGKLSLDDAVARYIPEFGAPRMVRVLNRAHRQSS